MNNLPQKGFTLIELIVFMTVVAIASTGLITTISNTLSTYNTHNSLIIAASLARSRMQVIIFNRQNNYAGLIDPCSSSVSGVCAQLATYATTNNLTVTTSIVENSPNKTINVSVNNTNSSSNYPLKTVVSDYE